jgi:hypothetical protein
MCISMYMYVCVCESDKTDASRGNFGRHRTNQEGTFMCDECYYRDRLNKQKE